MAMPKPSPGHSNMQKLAGNWEGKETMHPSQWDPQGGVAIGRNRNRLDLGGFALITNYEQERDGMITFTGHGVLTYDPDADRYTMHWFDCMGSPPEVFVGGFAGDVMTLAHGGPGMHARLTWDLTTPGKMISKMEMSADGQEWNSLFDAEYERS